MVYRKTRVFAGQEQNPRLQQSGKVHDIPSNNHSIFPYYIPILNPMKSPWNPHEILVKFHLFCGFSTIFFPTQGDPASEKVPHLISAPVSPVVVVPWWWTSSCRWWWCWLRTCSGRCSLQGLQGEVPKTIGKPWENHREKYGKYWKHMEIYMVRLWENIGKYGNMVISPGQKWGLLDTKSPGWRTSWTLGELLGVVSSPLVMTFTVCHAIDGP